MDLENIIPSEISQSEKDKYHMISLICGLMNKLNNKQNRDRHTDRVQADSSGWEVDLREGGGIEQKGKKRDRTPGHRHQFGDCGGEGVRGRLKRGLEGIHGDGKKLN